MGNALPGLEVRVVRPFDFPAEFDKAVKRFFSRSMLAMHGLAVERAPVDKGWLRNSLNPGAGITMVDKGRPPLWARVGSPLEIYPHVLDESDNHHYRAGPNAGLPTKGWLSEVPELIKPQVDDALNKLGADMVAAWRNG